MNGPSRGLAAAAAGLGVCVVAALGALLHRALRPIAEIRRYADDIEIATRGIANNLQVDYELRQIGELTAGVRRGLLADAEGTASPP